LAENVKTNRVNGKYECAELEYRFAYKKARVLWDVTIFRLVKSHRHFKGSITFIPGSRSPTRVQVGLFDLADVTSTVFRNVSKYLPLDAASYLTRLESATRALQGLQFLQVHINYTPEQQH
jgi:hypothetical protein